MLVGALACGDSTDPQGDVSQAPPLAGAAESAYALPSITDLLVVIDVGHGRRDPGTRSARGIAEYVFNRRLAKELAAALEAAGVRVVLVNGDGELHGSEGLRERTAIARRVAAQLLLSIHHDSVQPRYLKPWIFDGREERYTDAFHGYSLFVSRDNADFVQSMAVARRIADALLDRDLTPSLHHAEQIPGESRELLDAQRGIYEAPFWVIREAASPAVLIEAGIVANREEEARLDDPRYRQRIVEAIRDAVLAAAAP